MKTRTLGQNGPALSALGLGLMGIDGFGDAILINILIIS
jgi:aryl-alcohol dehydrogenase-like predicted oxidoreductase